jgi:hypothetical protein
MKVKEDPLSRSLADLENCLNEAPSQQQGWARSLTENIEKTRQAWLQHLDDAEGPDGIFSQVDLTRPSLVRQLGELRDEHEQLLALATELGHELTGAAPQSQSGSGSSDFELLQRRIRQFSERARYHMQRETDLVQESITTDLGAAD